MKPTYINGYEHHPAGSEYNEWANERQDYDAYDEALFSTTPSPKLVYQGYSRRVVFGKMPEDFKEFSETDPGATFQDHANLIADWNSWLGAVVADRVARQQQLVADVNAAIQGAGRILG